MIYSGDLTERLDFYRIVEQQTESGYHSVTEEFLLTTRAQRLKNKENYTVNADELFHVSELTFRLRYRREIEDTNIVVYEGEKYRITSLDKYPQQNELTIIVAKINE